jgi:hypothetical protein
MRSGRISKGFAAGVCSCLLMRFDGLDTLMGTERAHFLKPFFIKVDRPLGGSAPRYWRKHGAPARANLRNTPSILNVDRGTVS